MTMQYYKTKSVFFKVLLPMWGEGAGAEGTGRKCAILNGVGNMNRCSSV